MSDHKFEWLRALAEAASRDESFEFMSVNQENGDLENHEVKTEKVKHVILEEITQDISEQYILEKLKDESTITETIPNED